MSGRKNGLAALLTLALLGLGAALPYGTAALQDRTLGGAGDVRPLTAIQLPDRTAAPISEVLELVTGDYVTVERSDEAGMTEEEALAAALTAAELLTDNGLLETQALLDGKLSAQSVLLVAGDRAAVLWKCRWEQKGRDTCTLLLDDASGLMVGAASPYGPGMGEVIAMDKQTAVYSYYSVQNALAERAERWAEFCRAYYGFERARTADIIDKDSGERGFLLELSSGEGDAAVVCRLRLVLNDNGTSLNL